jgi:L-ascorbate metabolism protein UlaG (beta-lactamase superfamily)
MFDIEYKGGNTVVISTKKATMVADPKLSLVGQKDVSLKDAISLATEPRFSLDAPGARIVIDGPGEYEVADFSIRGMSATRHIDTAADEKLTTIYRIEVGEGRIGLVGNVAPGLSDDQLEFLGVIDILVLPVGGGGYTLDATSAAALVRQIDPKVVIPIHYADAALSYEVPQDTLELFTKEMGVSVEEMPKLKLKSIVALPQTLTVYSLQRTT